MKKLIVVCALLNFVLYMVLLTNIFIVETKETLSLQDVTNQSLTDAKEELSEFNIDVIYIDSQFKKDTVLYTIPSANKITIKGQTIKLYVSNGEITEYFENMLNKNIDEYSDYLLSLESKNINVIIKKQLSNDYQDGVIISQSNFGKVEEGQELIITVNYNEPLFEMPNFIGMSEVEFLAFMKEIDMKYIVIYSENKSKNTIYKQSINGGKLVLKSQCKLYIYIGV